MNYEAYLLSAEWNVRRQMMLDWAQNRCQICNSDHRLQVHHRTYERVGREHPLDLTVLCDDCHAKHHDKPPDVVPQWVRKSLDRKDAA